jgi:hypothetical protein
MAIMSDYRAFIFAASAGVGSIASQTESKYSIFMASSLSQFLESTGRQGHTSFKRANAANTCSTLVGPPYAMRL